MIVMPADHVIEPVQEFRRAVHAAEQMAEELPTALITFGIPPTYPATGYGYIHRGEPSRRSGRASRVFRVQAFREKPKPDLAEQYVACGEYYWNSGIFVWKAATILDELADAQAEADRRASAASPTPGARRGRTRCSVREYAKAREDQHRLRRDGARARKCWWCRRRTTGTTSAAGWRWSACNPQDADGNTVQATHCGIETHELRHRRRRRSS